MWLMYFVQALQSSLTANLSPYITSSFDGHSLLTVISIMTNIMTAACTMPIAKILNLWDRTVGFTLMLSISLVGLILMASCNNLATYCAAQVSHLPFADLSLHTNEDKHRSSTPSDSPG